LSEDVRRHKYGDVGGTPNLLVFPNLTSANSVYKAIELFSPDLVDLSAAFLCGIPKGVIGLLPRVSGTHAIVYSVHRLGLLADFEAAGR